MMLLPTRPVPWVQEYTGPVLSFPYANQERRRVGQDKDK